MTSQMSGCHCGPGAAQLKYRNRHGWTTLENWSTLNIVKKAKQPNVETYEHIPSSLIITMSQQSDDEPVLPCPHNVNSNPVL